MWCDSHETFLFDSNLDYWNKIHWYSHGTINRLQTAQAFIQDENINIRQRFHLACTYYFEDDVRTLWENMTLGYRTFLMKNIYLSSSRMVWLNTIKRRAPLNWTQITHTVERDNFSAYDSRKFSFRNHLGLLHAFSKQESPVARFISLQAAIRSRELPPFDLYLCLIQMEDSEILNTFYHLSENEKYVLIRTFLYWPLQDLFQNVVEKFRNNISNIIYSELFRFILSEKFETRWTDHDYVDLVKAFWAPLSARAKSEIAGHTMFPCLLHILENDGQQAVSVSFIRIRKIWGALRPRLF
ncbi:uncharacterized protein NPIL_302011 [Nephila pilipes]|uniref:Uncharacterized protein n=1 Tax=Nephila pilipes TaxID=299642 RepID=A0A8X6TMD2_NEPPI|nr:uncharacterized protein NPIL_302011 [Nephila pilipes]